VRNTEPVTAGVEARTIERLWAAGWCLVWLKQHFRIVALLVIAHSPSTRLSLVSRPTSRSTATPVDVTALRHVVFGASVLGLGLVTLKIVWRDGTSHLLFEVIELLAKFAAVAPRPASNLVRYSGVLALHARWQSQVGRSGGPALIPRRARSRLASTPLVLGFVDVARPDAPRVQAAC
jgi:hypothetical protein